MIRKYVIVIAASIFAAISSFGQELFPLVDPDGNLLWPSKDEFLSNNILSQVGITRSVNLPSDLYKKAPMRSGESVLVLSAGTFGNGGAALFYHDPAGVDATNTTSVIESVPGRWKVNPVFSGVVGGGGGGTILSIDGAYSSGWNFGDSAEVNISATGTNVTASLIDGSIPASRLSSAAVAQLGNRTNHTGTQSWSTLSDASTNVWLKIIAALQRGNGVHFSTNAGQNTLTISGNYLPGSGVSSVTNADGSVTFSVSTNAVVSVNGNPSAPANFTNGPDITPSLSSSNITLLLADTAVTAGTYTNATITVDAKGRITLAASGPGGPQVLVAVDGASTTNINLADSSDIAVTQTGSNVTHALTTTAVTPGTYTNATVTVDSKGRVTFAANGIIALATMVSVDGIATTNVNFGDSSELLVTQAGTNATYALATTAVAAGTYTNATVTVDSKGRVTFAQNGPVVTPVAVAVDGTGSTNVNLADSAELLVTQTGTDVTYLLATTAVTPGTYTNATVTVDSKGRVTFAASGISGTAIAVDGVATTNINLADSAELLVTQTGTNASYALATTAVSAGTYTNATVTVDSKGRVTFAANGSIVTPVTVAVDGVATTNVNLADSAELLVTQTGTNATYSLSTTAVTPGTYTNATVTVDSKGRLTFASSGSTVVSATNTTSGIWKTIAGVQFMATNSGTTVAIDESKTEYSGAGTNLLISGSTNLTGPISFTLDFNPVRNNTNYLIFADFQSSVGVGPAAVYVDNTDGRRTNGIKFVISSTYGSNTNFNQYGQLIRVWVVDPNVTVSGNEVTGIAASVITSGTIDVARIPASVMLDSEADARYGITSGNNTWSGVNVFTNDVEFLGNVAFNYIVASNFVSTTWTNTGNMVIGANLTVATNATVNGTLTVTNTANVGTANITTLNASNVTVAGSLSITGGGSMPNLTVSNNITAGETITAGVAMVAPYFDNTAPWTTTYQYSEMFNQNGVTASANSAYPWGSFALAGGTITSSDIVSTNHPGITRTVSSASASSGWGFAHRPTTMYIEQGMRFDFIIRPLQSDTNTQVDLGFINNINVNVVNQGVTATFHNGFVTLRSYTGSTTPNIHSVSNNYDVNAWYRGALIIDPDTSRGATLIVVNSDNGTNVLNTTFTTIPARTVAVGNDVRAFQYVGGTSNICDFDFLGLRLPTNRK